MMFQFPISIPTIRDYQTLCSSEEFKELEAFSNLFLKKNDAFLIDYLQKWVKDPFHQWSRQWEYPFVYAKIEKFYQQMAAFIPQILDAGSGVTFFPYFLKSKFPSSTVECVDIDGSLAEVFSNINRNTGSAVNFNQMGLDRLEFSDGSFDIIYCISVLEHTEDYAAIIREFSRVLKPGGRLVVTFDISLDGLNEILPEKAGELVEALFAEFVKENVYPSMVELLTRPDLVTTRYAYRLNPALLPWKGPSLKQKVKSFLKGEAQTKFPPNFTVYCLSARKK